MTSCKYHLNLYLFIYTILILSKIYYYIIYYFILLNSKFYLKLKYKQEIRRGQICWEPKPILYVNNILSIFKVYKIMTRFEWQASP